MNLAQTPPDSPWASLWRQIGNAEWVANIGLPLAVTVIALTFAVGAFFLQQWIEHQRRLVDRRREFAGQFADSLRGFANDLVEAVRFDDYMSTEVWRSKLVAIRDAQSRVRLAAGRATRRFSNDREMDTTTTYLVEVGMRWITWLEYADRLGGAALGSGLLAALPPIARHDAAQLTELADIYEEWDGRVDGRPDVSTLHLPVTANSGFDPDDSEGMQRWIGQKQTEFARLIDAHAGITPPHHATDPSTQEVSQQ